MVALMTGRITTEMTTKMLTTQKSLVATGTTMGARILGMMKISRSKVSRMIESACNSSIRHPLINCYTIIKCSRSAMLTPRPHH